MRIGLLGGSFNPIHNGHLTLAENAQRHLRLDKVIFMPAYIPPHKKASDLIDAEKRYQTVALAIRGRRSFEASDFEIDKRQRSYSIETVEYLKARYPEQMELFFIIGSDMLAGLKQWKDSDNLLKLCRFAVAARPRIRMVQGLRDIITIPMDPIGVSSTQIRRRIREGKSISAMVPPRVAAYIKAHGLYR